MSFKTEVIADRSGRWAGNDLCFATESEAKFYVRDLMWRWTSVTDTRTIEGSWPVAHRWNDADMKAERLPD
jgi:hypothetical protein